MRGCICYTGSMKSLDEIRVEIDRLDDEILRLLSMRAKQSLEVKKTPGGSGALRRGRETAIVRRIVEKNEGPFSDDAVRDIFESIVYNGRGLQLELSVAYLGPEGTYSEQAAHEMFGTAVHMLPKRSPKQALQSLEMGEVQIAVLPIENSTEGAVVGNHRLIRDVTVPIIAEHTLQIHHALLSKGTNLATIKKVYAHAQALGQCREWLEVNLPNAELVDCASNARGLELASTTDTAAIASERSAVQYDVNVLETIINDDPSNATRFIAFGHDLVPATGHDKTSLVCTVHDKAGALYELLGVLNSHGISMTRLESQSDKDGGYAFFIDFMGHKDDKYIAKALAELEKCTATLKLLGSYPAELS